MLLLIKGLSDIKSLPVSFHAQRVGNYDAVNTVVPYNLIRLNVGNALNFTTFTITTVTISATLLATYSRKMFLGDNTFPNTLRLTLN